MELVVCGRGLTRGGVSRAVGGCRGEWGDARAAVTGNSGNN
jgi:hypothetical protein